MKTINKRRHMTLLAIATIHFHTVITSHAQEYNAISPAVWERFEEQCKKARKLQLSFRGIEEPTRIQRIRAAVPELSNLAVYDPLETGVISYLCIRSRLLIASDDDNKTILDIKSLCAATATAPETIELLRTLVSDPTENGSRRRAIEAAIGYLLPVSIYGGDRDNSISTRLIDPEYPDRFMWDTAHRPTIPAIDESKLARIADAYVEQNMHRQAMRAYVEAVYARDLPVGWRAWSSFQITLWLKAAQAALANGDMRDFGAYTAKAIIFGDEIQAVEGYELLKQAVETKQDAQPAAPRPEKTKLLKSARLYVEMNMHPRAFELLKEYKDLIGPEGRELAETWKAEWLRLVAQYCEGRTACVLFGQDVSTPEKAAAVRIPWPCEKESLAEAARIVESLPLLRNNTTSAPTSQPTTSAPPAGQPSFVPSGP